MSKIFRWQWICRYGELWRTSVISDRASEFSIRSYSSIIDFRLVGAQGGAFSPRCLKVPQPRWCVRCSASSCRETPTDSHHQKFRACRHLGDVLLPHSSVSRASGSWPMPGEDLSLEGNDLALASNGLEVRRNSARGTALCFSDSPLLVGAPEPDRTAYRYGDISGH